MGTMRLVFGEHFRIENLNREIRKAIRPKKDCPGNEAVFKQIMILVN